MSVYSFPSVPLDRSTGQGVAVVVTNQHGQVLLHRPYRAAGRRARWMVLTAPLRGRELPTHTALRLIRETMRGVVDDTDVTELFQLEGLPAPLAQLAVFAVSWHTDAEGPVTPAFGFTESCFLEVEQARTVPCDPHTEQVLDTYLADLPEWERMRGITDAWEPARRPQRPDPRRHLARHLTPVPDGMGLAAPPGPGGRGAGARPAFRLEALTVHPDDDALDSPMPAPTALTAAAQRPAPAAARLRRLLAPDPSALPATGSPVHVVPAVDRPAATILNALAPRPWATAPEDGDEPAPAAAVPATPRTSAMNLRHLLAPLPPR
ncbi:hypothetical protein ACFC1T_08900 [Kitasatospora sp. NPDC056076]|uniref:hypothetical protein n=1 Tax=Kitasatospora sp. NPDC056076 TaxID=3345703 RepID=UPI0035E068A1